MILCLAFLSGLLFGRQCEQCKGVYSGKLLKQMEFSDRKTHSLEPRASGVLGDVLSGVPKLLNPDLDKGLI